MPIFKASEGIMSKDLRVNTCAVRDNERSLGLEISRPEGLR